MLPPFALAEDVEGIWRPLTPAETDLVTNRIQFASEQVRDDVPLVNGLTVDQRLADGSLRRETVRGVVVGMVHRLVSVPGYLKQRTVLIDGDSESVTFHDSVAAGEMVITDQEMNRLLGRKASRGRAFTIVPGPGASWT